MFGRCVVPIIQSVIYFLGAPYSGSLAHFRCTSDRTGTLQTSEKMSEKRRRLNTRTAVTAGGCSRNHLIMSHQDSSHCWWVLQESPDHVSSGQQSLLDSSHCWWVLQESPDHVSSGQQSLLVGAPGIT
ncbi:hypothetical protein LSAT2_027306 [Lamellibrachia satsuma]|nr:hypothetical protein LSAT2_027306 [Lamellibrachia satsuma]